MPTYLSVLRSGCFYVRPKGKKEELHEYRRTSKEVC